MNNNDANNSNVTNSNSNSSNNNNNNEENEENEDSNQHVSQQNHNIHNRFSDFKERVMKKKSYVFEIDSTPCYFQGGIVKYSNRPKIVRRRRVKRNNVRGYTRNDEDDDNLHHSSFIELSPISSSSSGNNDIDNNNNNNFVNNGDVVLDESIFSSTSNSNIPSNNNNNNNIKGRSRAGTTATAASIPTSTPTLQSPIDEHEVVNDNIIKSKTLNSIKNQLNEQKKEKEQLEKELNEIIVNRTWKQTFFYYLGLGEIFTTALYKAASMELIGSAIFVFMSLTIFISSVNLYNFAYDSDAANYPPQQVLSSVPNYRIPITAGVLHIPLLFLLILATAPISGGHLNSSITFATFLAGYTSFTRCVFYIIAQTTGGIIGSAILRGIIPFDVMKRTNLGICTFGNDITYGGALGLEYMLSLFNLLIAFGVALDPRQASVLGPIGGALAVAFTVGVSIIGSAGIAPSYIFGFNITRCLPPAIVSGDLTHVWPYIVGPLLASFTIGFYIYLVPPFKSYQTPQYIIEKCKKIESKKN